MNLRLTEHHYRELRRLTAGSFLAGVEFPPETGCILLVNVNDHPARPALLVTEVLPPEDGDLAERGRDGLVFSSRYLRRALLKIRERGLAGFLTVHTHPHSDTTVGFSWYDDENDPKLMNNLYELRPEGVFGSVVLGEQSAAARLWRPDGTYSALEDMVIVGEHLEWMPLNGRPRPAPPDAADLFDRSRALTGDGALARLARMRVGVIGASGTGSVVVELLARAGAGEIVVFDFDALESVNLNRILHSRRRDADARADKAKRLAEAVNDLGLPTKVTVARGGDVRRGEVAQELRGCDLIFGCVDKDWPRLVLCQASYQFIIPYIDLGTEIGVVDGEVRSVDSRVSYVAPGRACLVCSGVVSAERVALEGFEETERDRVIAMGYSQDIRLVAPAVMDLNMRAASYAVLVARHLLQPFLDAPLPTHIKEALTNYSTRPLHRKPSPDCFVCGIKERVGGGSVMRLTTKN